MISLVVSILAFVLALVCFVYSIHVSLVFKCFNDGIKDWATNLDNSTYAAIQKAARQILKELDEKITEHKALERQEYDIENLNVEPINEENVE